MDPVKAKRSPAQTTPAGLRKSYKHASLKQRYGVAANRLKDRSWKDGIFLLSNDFSYVFHLSVPSSHFRELMARTLAMETSVSTQVGTASALSHSLMSRLLESDT